MLRTSLFLLSIFLMGSLVLAGCAEPEVQADQADTTDAAADEQVRPTDLAPQDEPQDGLAEVVSGFREIDPQNPPPGSPIGRSLAYVGDAYVQVIYARPYKRGRDIFGDVVPYDELWITGAHYATEIMLTQPLEVTGEPLEAGIYSLFTTPGEETWQVHFNTELGMHQPSRYDAANNALTVEVPSEQMDEPVEIHTIDFEHVDGGTDMRIAWDQTRVRIPLAPAGN